LVCGCLDLCQVGCGWMNYVHFDMWMLCMDVNVMLCMDM
jgi:hypothetical protein